MNLDNRMIFWDNLKVCLIILMIYDHSALPFIPWEGWFFSFSNPNDRIPSIMNFVLLNSTFIMAVFFFMSGYFMPMSFDNRSCFLFIKKKFLRYIVPSVICGIIFKIAINYFIVYHLWYLETLFVFSAVYALFRTCIGYEYPSSKCFPLSLKGISFISLTVGILAFLIGRYSYYYDYKIFCKYIIELIHYPQYIVMFCLGILSYRIDFFKSFSDKKGLFLLASGSILAFCLSFFNISYREVWYPFYETFLSVYLGLGLLWLFHKFCNWDNSFWKWCSEQSFGAYVFHAFVLFAVDCLFDDVLVNVYIKFVLIGTLTAIGSFFFSWILRRIPIVRCVL